MGGDIMTLARKQSISNYNHRYNLVNGERSENGLFWLCVYCGEPSTCRDHVPPITRVGDYEALGLKTEMYLKIPSCDHCNKIASDSIQESVFERIEYVKDKLKAKNKRKLKTYEWSEEELNELGKNLRSKVAVENKKAVIIRKKIEYYGGFDSLMDSLAFGEVE